MTNLEKYVQLLKIEESMVKRKLTGSPIHKIVCNRLDELLDKLDTTDYIKLTDIIIKWKNNNDG